MAHIRGKTFTWKPVFTRLRYIFLFFCLMSFYALTSKLLTGEGFASKIEIDIVFFSTISTIYLVLVSTFSQAVAKKL
jgi:hypothetical protein